MFKYEKFLRKLKKSIQKYTKEKLGYTRAPSFHSKFQHSDFDTYTFKNCDAHISLKIDKYFPEKFEDDVLNDVITKITLLVSKMINDKFFHGYILEINNPYFITLYCCLDIDIMKIKLNDNIYKLDNNSNYANRYLLGLKTFLRADKSTSTMCLLRNYMYDDIDFLYNIHLNGNRILYNKRDTIIDNEISLRSIIEIVEDYEHIDKEYNIDIFINNQSIYIGIAVRNKSTILKIDYESSKISIDDLRELLKLQVRYTKNIKCNFNRCKINDIITIKNKDDINKLKLQVF